MHHCHLPSASSAVLRVSLSVTALMALMLDAALGARMLHQTASSACNGNASTDLIAACASLPNGVHADPCDTTCNAYLK